MLFRSRHAPLGDESIRKTVFALIDAAFSQRRKMVRSSMSAALGPKSEAIIAAAGVDPTLRGEALEINQYLAIALEFNRAS